MIITIGGLPGSGKSTLKNKLAEKLGLKKYSVGDLRGKMAAERGMTIDEFNALGQKEAFTDKDADAYQEKLGQTEDNFVIDGRLSWHFIPHSVKIFVTVDAKEAAKRIFKDRRTASNRNDEPLYDTVEEAEKAISGRIESDRARYEKWYGLDFTDLKNYDLVIDTTNLTAEEALQKALDFVANRKS